MPEKIQKADPRLRRLMIGWLLSGIVVGVVLILSLKSWQVEFELLSRNDPRKAGELIARYLRWFVILNAVLMAGLALWLWRFSRKISASGRFPPPGVSVIRDTVIKTGPAAGKYAIAGYFFALIFLVLGGLMVFMIERIRNFL